MGVDLLPGLDALSTQEVVDVASSGAGGCADPASTCFHDGSKVLKPLAQMLLSHLQIHHVCLICQISLSNLLRSIRIILVESLLFSSRFLLYFCVSSLFGHGRTAQGSDRTLVC
jgi:hypothetical protein